MDQICPHTFAPNACIQNPLFVNVYQYSSVYNNNDEKLLPKGRDAKNVRVQREIYLLRNYSKRVSIRGGVENTNLFWTIVWRSL
uniref:Uncharacterized protein n=1 Tax=Triticum urartu TaxID=4572 RepID=A0A8R7Q3C6_TRIUA